VDARRCGAEERRRDEDARRSVPLTLRERRRRQGAHRERRVANGGRARHREGWLVADTTYLGCSSAPGRAPTRAPLYAGVVLAAMWLVRKRAAAIDC